MLTNQVPLVTQICQLLHYTVPSGMRKLMESAHSPHATRLTWNMVTHVMSAVSDNIEAMPEAMTTVCTCAKNTYYRQPNTPTFVRASLT